MMGDDSALTLVVTGAAGFVGSHLVPELESAGHSVTPWTRERGDLLKDTGQFRAELGLVRPDVVVHLAALVGINAAQDRGADIAHAANATMTANVADATSSVGARLLYASSAIVAAAGLDAYADSKRAGEERSLEHAPSDLLVARIAYPYGPRSRPGRSALVTMLHQAHHRQPIRAWRDVERSWCWIGDTTRAIRLLIERRETGTWDVGRCDDPRPLTEIAQLACKLTGAPPEIVTEVDPPAIARVPLPIDDGPLRNLGWEPRVELEDGMRRTLEWVTSLDRELS